MSENKKIPITFKIYRKDETGRPVFLREETLHQDVIKVGKGPAADLRLDDENAGLVHAYIQISGEEINIMDVVSQKGTFVNNNRINKSVLSSGDEILIGDSILFVSWNDESASSGRKKSDESSDFIFNAQHESAVNFSSMEDTTRRQAMLVTAFHGDSAIKTSMLSDHKNGEKTGKLSIIAIIVGVVLMASGIGLGWMSLEAVREQQSVNSIIKDIAKTRGLSDKFVPKVQGNTGLELAFIGMSLLGAVFFFTGLSIRVRRKNTLANYTIGEDPKAEFNCPSKDLPDHRFPLVKTDRVTGYHLLFSDRMEGNITDVNGTRYMLAELIQQGKAVPSSQYQGVYDFEIPDNHSAAVKYGPYSFIIKALNQPKLAMAFSIPGNLFMGMVFGCVALAASMAMYFSHIQEDPLFSQDVDQQEITISKIVKTPPQAAVIEKKLKPVKLKDEKDQKIIHQLTSKTNNKASSPKDPRSVTQNSGTGGVSVGLSRLSGSQSQGVANVLSSNMSALTANLTASNTVFGQESENFDDLLGDADPDGEAVDGGFGNRGSNGGGPSGGLGIPGNGNTGWGGIGGPGNGPGGPFHLGPLNDVNKRKIITRGGTAVVHGKLDPNEVRAVIHAHRREVHHCYQKGLMMNDKVAGTVRIEFMINPMGRVQTCNVIENLAVSSVGSCICTRTYLWKFPQPQGGLARIVYAWTLTPGN